MTGNREITYGLDPSESGDACPEPVAAYEPIPRIARLLALAFRFEELMEKQGIEEYASLARAGHVTRARISQIMRLLDLAPDIQEQLLFMRPMKRINEHNLRPIACRIDFAEQRRQFQKLCGMDLTRARDPR
jgi:hypothetical protein